MVLKMANGKGWWKGISRIGSDPNWVWRNEQPTLQVSHNRASRRMVKSLRRKEGASGSKE